MLGQSARLNLKSLAVLCALLRGLCGKTKHLDRAERKAGAKSRKGKLGQFFLA